MKNSLHAEITCTESGAALVVLNGLPAYHDVTMSVKQLKALAAILVSLAEATEKGGVGVIEHEYYVSDYKKTLID